MPITSTYSKDNFDKQGHRGCRGLLPENTIPAMIRAIDLGVTTLEMDVVITKDQQVVLSHEPFFSHDITTNQKGEYLSEEEEKTHNIYSMPYAVVTRYDVGMKPHPRFPQQQKIKVVKPLLSALIDSVEMYKKEKQLSAVHYNIEIKSQLITDTIFHPDPAVFTKLVMDVIETKNLQQRVIIQSFDKRPLQYLHQHYPAIRTALLIEDHDSHTLTTHLQQLGFTPTIYSPHYSLVTKSLVQQCKERQMKIIPWTVNDSIAMKALMQLGVDGIITDYPNLFGNILQ